MSEELVLVDTSAWLSVAHPEHGREFQPIIASLQAANRVATNWLIRAELLTGAKDETDYRRLDDELCGLHHLALHDEVWSQVARLRFQLKRRGCLLPLVDVSIASCAMVYGCQLLHLDRHFDLIARHAPLKVCRAARSRAT